MNDSVLTLSVGQALEVQDALRRQQLPLSFLKDVTSGTWFSQMNEVMCGRAKIVPIQIDPKPVATSVAATIPDTFCVDYSIKGTYPDWMKKRLHPEFDRSDTVEHRLDQVSLWLHSDQGSGGRIGGKALYQHIKENDILPTCLALRDLEEIQKLGIEVYRKYFRGKAIFAWKDVVQGRNGRWLVPFLIGHGDQVFLGWHWLDGDWDDFSPAARFAS